ncbi:MAG TPA: hypothetical protein IAA05_04065 [Candidatus Blautia excrementipullorum]|nr:hypothetical protein [Candidatus Blautia excrementipullorum]
MLEIIKERCGIPEEIEVYDKDIALYLKDCLEDMKASGVPESILDDPRAVTAATLYVKAHLGDDRTDTEKYMELYRQKVFRLTLEEG